MATSGKPTVVLAESCQATIKDTAFWETGAWVDCGEDAYDFVDGYWYCLKHTPLPVEPDEAWYESLPPELKGCTHIHADTEPDPWQDYPKWSPPPLPPFASQDDAPF